MTYDRWKTTEPDPFQFDEPPQMTIDTSKPPRIIDADQWHLYLSENTDALPMVAVQICELFEELDRANGAYVKDAFERGYKGGLKFAIAVCGEKDADIEHVQTRCTANLYSLGEAP